MTRSHRRENADPPRAAYRFLLDADISPLVADIACRLGIDAVSVYSCGRGALRDDEQLRNAATDGRIFVTRNRNDFLRWTVEFIRTGEPHRGVLIVPRSIPATSPKSLAHALVRWTRRMESIRGGEPLDPYFIDFLPPRE